MALTLITVPLTLHYLGSERYGMWVTISSLVALLSFADLGIGYGLLNAVTRATATYDAPRARSEIASAVVLMIGVVAVLIVAFGVMSFAVSWPRVFAVSSPAAVAEAGPGVAAWYACFLAGLPLSIVTQVRMARQEAYVSNMASAAGNLVSVLALVFVIAMRGGLPVLVLAMTVPPLLATCVNGAFLFRRDAPELRPSLSLADRRTEVALLRAGSLFFVLQLAISVAFTSDTLVVTRILGPQAAAEYGVVTRLFLIPSGLIGIVLTPLWPAYGDALVRGDLAWARRTLRMSFWIVLAVALPSAVVLVVFGQPIIRVWAGSSVLPTMALLVGCGIWLVQGSLGNAVAMLLNGAGEIRWQAWWGAVMAVANLALSIWLTFRIGVAGVIWGTVVTYFVLVLVPMAVYVPRVLRRLEALAGTQAARDLEIELGAAEALPLIETRS